MAEPKMANQERVIGPFCMADEERDIGAFQAYVAALGPTELWDVLSHLDEEHYPRRRETVLREMARRRLFFVTPYSRLELGLRNFLLLTLFLTGLTLLLHAVGASTLEPPPYGRLPFFTDLAVGSPKAARLLLPVFLPVAAAAAVATVPVTGYAVYLLWRRRAQIDLVVLAVLATLLSGGLVLLSWSP